MKNKDTQLLEEAYDQIKENDVPNDPTAELRKAIDNLIPLVETGQVTYGSESDSNSIKSILAVGTKKLESAMRRHVASKTPSDVRSARSKAGHVKSKQEKEEADRLYDLGFNVLQAMFGGYTTSQIAYYANKYKDKYGTYPTLVPFTNYKARGSKEQNK